ncbi:MULTISPECIES: porin [Anaeromyxobacter]|uniref:porin n=1 Tax=Anaeromyxobacter TaxID=161492 RepID=UPI001F564D97|nr:MULTISPECIES: porin [unclassified Anaeromyxobacter]
MNRLTAVLAVLALCPALARAQEAAAAPQQVPAEQQAPAAAQGGQEETPFDGSAIQGKVDSLAEQYAETKTDVASLKKLKFSGYVQGRYAWQESTAADFNTTPESAPAQQGFFIRRGRLKAAYDADWSQFVLQLDATPAGVSAKEAFASIKLPWQGFAIDAGLQLFPFGYEVGVRSSSDLDLLERSAVVRAYLAGEYDLGVALKGVYGPLNFKVGLFNGDGVDAKQAGYDNDQRKDVIGRLGVDLGMLTGGVSGWYGKTVNYVASDDPEYDRYRLGADAQLYLDLLPVGGTALKGEYIWGRTTISDKNGGAGDKLGKTGHGWYGLATQNVGRYHQVAFRYEEFTADNTLPLTGTNVKTAREIQAAVHTFVGEGGKISLAWAHPMNGDRAPGVSSDPKRDQFIVQAQAKF